MRSRRSDEWPCSKRAALALTVAAALGLAACNGNRSQARCSTKRCVPSGPPRASRQRTKTTFTTWTARLPLTKEQIEGRNMWIVWTGGNDRLWDVLSRESLGSLDFLKTMSSHPTLPVLPRHPLELPRAGQRTVLQESHRTRPEPLRALARCPRPRLRTRPVRQCRQIQGRPDRRARQDGSGRLLLRRAHRHRWPAPVPESGFRRGGAQEMGFGALLPRRRPTTSREIWSNRIASACRAGSATSGPTR